MQLPTFADYVSFRAWKLDTSQSLPAAIDIARSHGLSCAAPHVFATGSNLVIGLDDLILKIFPPLLRRQFVSERTASWPANGGDSRYRRRRRARRLALPCDYPSARR